MSFQSMFATFLLLLEVVSGAALVQKPLQLDPFEPGIHDPLAYKKLKDVVGDRLIVVDPVGKPCYTPNSATSPGCIEAYSKRLDDFWTADQPGGYFYGNLGSCQANDQICSLPTAENATVAAKAICHQGSVPSILIKVLSIETLIRDIKAAFEYANKTKTPLVVKNTGHDWKGRSAAPGSIALWTHKLQHPDVPIELHEHFVPANCPAPGSNTVISVGPGQQWGPAYQWVEERGLALLGGTCPTVGIAGWLQGGGHSPLTPMYGMGVDNVQQIEIVTPKGDQLIASACQNEYLFFAIRGGGGGTFGVITRLWYTAVSKLDFWDFHVDFKTANDDDLREYMKILTSNAVKWAEKGWGGYIKADGTGQHFQMVHPKSTLKQVWSDMEPIVNFLNPRNYKFVLQRRDSWFQYVEQVMAPHPSLWSMTPASRLLPKDLFADVSRDKLTESLMQIYNIKKLNFWLMFVAPTAYPHTTTSALHPSWANAVMSLRIHDRWDQYNDTLNNRTTRSHFEAVHNGFDVIRELVPDMGISISEADVWEEDHAHHFWGDVNYQNLSRIKKEVDPHNLLSNWHAVNWNVSETRYNCYPKQ